MIVDTVNNNLKSLFISDKIDVTNEWQNLIINSTPDFIYSYDAEGHLTSANSELCKSLQLTEEEIIGKTNKEIGFPKKYCHEFDAL